MRERQPPTQTIKASDIRQQWRDVVNKVARKETRIIVEKSGVPVAAIVSADDLAQLQQLDAKRDALSAALEAAGEAFKDVPDEELAREVTQALAEVRAAHRPREKPAGHAT